MKSAVDMRTYSVVLLTWLFIITVMVTSASGSTFPVKVGVYQNAPLTFVEEDGNVKGFFIDISAYIARRNDWKIEYVPCSFPECLSYLEDGSIDLLGVIAYSEVRAEKFDYTYESVITNWGQIYLNKNSDIESIIDLKGKKVAVLQNDIYFNKLRKLVNQFGIKCRFIEAFEYEDVLELVDIGRCEAGLVSQIYGLQRERDYDIIKSSILLSPQKLYWAAAKGKNQELLNTLDRYIRELKDNHQSVFYEALGKWFGIGKKTALGKWVKWMIGSFVILLILFFTVSLISRAQVKSKTSELMIKNEELRKEILSRKQAEEERKKMEFQLRQAHKMESIGTLAGGIAHDFNNILGIILGNTELALDNVPEWKSGKHNLEEIKTASLRAKDVVRQLLSFARKTELEKKTTNIVSIIKESIKLLRSSIPKSIEIQQDIPTDVFNIKADPTQINQVLINLCTNAAHAMPDGGIINVTLKNVNLDESTTARYPDIDPGQYVHLKIHDTGSGISKEEIARIFDPYFTTKDVGKGTGMGLAVVHGIIEEHHGIITVESEVGKGTIFNIFFPAVKDQVAIEPEPNEKLPKGDETILFIDDEPSIVYVGKNRLERLGYHVETKTSSVESLELFHTHSERFDLVITDMTMPRISGDQLTKEILKIRPNIPIILCTGFSEKMDKRTAKNIGAVDYVEKPVDWRDLAFKMRRVLDRK